MSEQPKADEKRISVHDLERMMDAGADLEIQPDGRVLQRSVEAEKFMDGLRLVHSKTTHY